MADVKNIYFNVGEDYPPEKVREKIIFAYNTYPKIRMIFDLDNVNISGITAMKKIKKIFEELGVQKLVETCVVAKDGFKLMLVKQFLRLVKTERPVRFL